MAYLRDDEAFVVMMPDREHPGRMFHITSTARSLAREAREEACRYWTGAAGWPDNNRDTWRRLYRRNGYRCVKVRLVSMTALDAYLDAREGR